MILLKTLLLIKHCIAKISSGLAELNIGMWVFDIRNTVICKKKEIGGVSKEPRWLWRS